MPLGVGYSAPMSRNVTGWAIGLCGLLWQSAQAQSNNLKGLDSVQVCILPVFYEMDGKKDVIFEAILQDELDKRASDVDTYFSGPNEGTCKFFISFNIQAAKTNIGAVVYSFKMNIRAEDVSFEDVLGDNLNFSEVQIYEIGSFGISEDVNSFSSLAIGKLSATWDKFYMDWNAVH